MIHQLNRRAFLGGIAAAGSLHGQSYLWGGPVLDMHLHIREGRTAFEHIEGCGVTNAVLLPGQGLDERAKAEIAQHKDRFVRFVRADVTKPDAIAQMTIELKAGAIGLGEIKYQVALDSPEMRKVYDLAADFGVPVTQHFQEVQHFAEEGLFSTGFSRFGAMLKAHPRTTFLGHADAFWANVSADIPKDVAYPEGPIKPGGLTDKWLADFPNLYGDMSANSCNNTLNRDPDFMRGFLALHQDKLMFGSDCGCLDGRGKNNQPILAPRLKGKCMARETLTALQRLTTPKVFRKIAWGNGTKLLKLSA